MINGNIQANADTLKCFDSPLNCYNLETYLNQSFQKFQPILGSVSFTAHPSGYTIGSANWMLNIEGDEVNFHEFSKISIFTSFSKFPNCNPLKTICNGLASELK